MRVAHQDEVYRSRWAPFSPLYGLIAYWPVNETVLDEVAASRRARSSTIAFSRG